MVDAPLRQTAKSNFAILIFQVKEIDGELRELKSQLGKITKALYSYK
jgi:hypothetical protein